MGRENKSKKAKTYIIKQEYAMKNALESVMDVLQFTVRAHEGLFDTITGALNFGLVQATLARKELKLDKEEELDAAFIDLLNENIRELHEDELKEKAAKITEVFEEKYLKLVPKVGEVDYLADLKEALSILLTNIKTIDSSNKRLAAYTMASECLFEDLQTFEENRDQFEAMYLAGISSKN